MRVSLIAILASVAWAAVATASGNGLRVDFSEPDPAGLDELPGILSWEIERLREAAGPGEASLEDRLAATGISRDRLAGWLPYITLPERRPMSSRWAARTVAHGRHEGPAAAATRIRLDQAKASARIAWAGDPANGGRSDPIARIALRASDRVTLHAGTMAAGLHGPEAWKDPITPGNATVTTIGRPAFREKPGVRGGGVETGPLTLGIWSDRRASGGLVLTGNIDPVRVWYAAKDADGRGGGIALARAGKDWTIAWSDPEARPPALRVSIQTNGGGGGIAAAWSAAARKDRRLGAFAARRAGRSGWLRWSLRTEAIVAERIGDARERVDLEVRGRGSRRSWECRFVRAAGSSTWEIGADPLPADRIELRLEHRGKSSARGISSFWALRLAGDGVAAARLEGALLLRSDPTFAWPDPGAGLSGVAAVRLGVAAVGPRLRGRALLVVTRGDRSARWPVGWRIEIERSGEG